MWTGPTGRSTVKMRTGGVIVAIEYTTANQRTHSTRFIFTPVCLLPRSVISYNTSLTLKAKQLIGFPTVSNRVPPLYEPVKRAFVLRKTIYPSSRIICTPKVEPRHQLALISATSALFIPKPR